MVFKDVKYSRSYLDQLMEPISQVLEEADMDLLCGFGVDVMENCLGVDIHSDGKDIPKEVLAKLAQLDPDGGAIRVRLHTGRLDTLTDETVKGPAPAPAAPDEQPVPAVTEDSDQIYHGEDAPADAIPGGMSPVGELPQTKGEDIQPARHDLLPPGE